MSWEGGELREQPGKLQLLQIPICSLSGTMPMTLPRALGTRATDCQTLFSVVMSP